MKTVFKQIILSCAVLGFASITTLANAQEHPMTSCKSAANPQDCMQTHMVQHMQEHETKLHDALKLTAAQEPAWKTYTDAMHQQIASMEADRKTMPARAEQEKMTAPDLLQHHLSMMQKHVVAMQAHLEATKTLYAVLTPQQQATINAEAQKMGHHQAQHGGDHSHPAMK